MSKLTRNSTVKPAVQIFVLLVFIVLLFPGLSPGAETGGVLNIQMENDFFGGGTDRNFTHGTRMEYVTGPIEWISDAADKLPWFDSERSGQGAPHVKARASIAIGQNIFTPENTTAFQLLPDQRPYAGWLYMGFGLAANQGNRRYDKVYLEVGIVGPNSFGEEVQSEWHTLFGLKVPNGWDHQLDNEPGLVLYYEQARRFNTRDMLFGLEYDVIPHFGGSLGNVFTYGACGFTLRVGADLKKDFGPPRIRPSLPGGGFFRTDDGFNWYIFAGTEGRAVLRNIFLDGNTFSHSPSVDKKPFVGDVQAGLASQWGKFRLSYTQIYRSKEYKGQSSGDIFGSLTISYRF
jgi:lipid A 3-O-deacylase